MDNDIIKKSTYNQAFGQYGKEVVNPRCLELGAHRPNPHSLLVYHLHDLPLLAVLGRTPVLGATEVVLGRPVVFTRKLRLNDDFIQFVLVLFDALHDVVPNLDEVLLLDDEAQGLQDLLFVREVLVAAALLV